MDNQKQQSFTVSKATGWLTVTTSVLTALKLLIEIGSQGNDTFNFFFWTGALGIYSSIATWFILGTWVALILIKIGTKDSAIPPIKIVMKHFLAGGWLIAFISVFQIFSGNSPHEDTLRLATETALAFGFRITTVNSNMLILVGNLSLLIQIATILWLFTTAETTENILK
jgi:hypothetical protein